MPQLLRVQNFMLSTDGFGAGEGQSLEAPFGHAEARGGRTASLPADLASWAFATASWAGRTEPGGSRGLDDYFTRDFARNIGAEIMGRNKFGPQRGPWENLDWKGWWGDTPPFHTPVFVLTHHHRPSFTLADTTFHFVDATAAEEGYSDMLRGVDRKPLASLEGMRNLQRLLKPRNPKIGELKVEDVVDNRIMRKLDESGFIDRAFAAQGASFR